MVSIFLQILKKGFSSIILAGIIMLSRPFWDLFVRTYMIPEMGDFLFGNFSYSTTYSKYNSNLNFDL